MPALSRKKTIAWKHFKTYVRYTRNTQTLSDNLSSNKSISNMQEDKEKQGIFQKSQKLNAVQKH